MHSLLRILMTILIAVILTNCSSWSISRYPQPPEYPNAQNVVHGQERDGKVQVTTFETEETPEIVTQFYRKKLVEEGWVFAGDHPAGDLRYYESKYNTLIDITISDHRNGKTRIELRQFEYDPHNTYLK